jgi:hypothetical protein
MKAKLFVPRIRRAILSAISLNLMFSFWAPMMTPIMQRLFEWILH